MPEFDDKKLFVVATSGEVVFFSDEQVADTAARSSGDPDVTLEEVPLSVCEQKASYLFDVLKRLSMPKDGKEQRDAQEAAKRLVSEIESRMEQGII